MLVFMPSLKFILQKALVLHRGTGSIGYILYNYCSDITQMYLASPRCSIELCLYEIIVVIVIFAEQIFGSRRDMP